MNRWLVGVVIACVLCATANAQHVMRVFELYHADARMIAGMLGGLSLTAGPPGLEAWADSVIRQAVAAVPPGTSRQRWFTFTDVRPASPSSGAGSGLLGMFDIGQLPAPPVALADRNALLVKGTPEQLDRVAELIRILDQPADMVNVEVKLEDVPTHVLRGWGIDLRVWGQGAEAASTGNAPAEGLLLSLGLGRADVLAGLVDTEARGKTVHAVNGTTTSGIPFEIAFGQVLPYFTASVTYDVFGRRHIDYVPHAVFIGFYLWCLPRVTAADLIHMTLRPTFSYYAGAVTSPRGERLPIVTYKGLTTTVTVPDGHSLVIGGLRQLRDEVNRRFRGLLHDVRVQDSSNPTMIVTPRIVRPFPAE